MPDRYLYLVRHGQYAPATESGDGRGGHLTRLGQQQARRIARRLAGLPVDVIYHSDLHRAVETAAIIAERFPGAPVRQFRHLREGVPAVPTAFAEHFLSLPAETLARERAQAERAFDRHFKRTRRADRHELIVAHGNLIRYLACRVLQVPPEAWASMDVHNCGLSEVVIEPGRMRLVSLNDTGHLPLKLKTFF